MDLRGHTSAVDQLGWNPVNADVLATASSDKTLRFWDTKTGACVSVRACACVLMNFSCRNTGKSFQTISTPGENINVNWHPEGTAIAVGNKVGSLLLPWPFVEALSPLSSKTWFPFMILERGGRFRK